MNRLYAVLGAGLLMMSFSATAQVTGSVGYSHASVDSADVGLLQGTLGYRFPIGAARNVWLIPEGRVGTGVKDDTIGGVKVEIDEFYGALARLQFESAEGFYGFVYPSYTRFKVKGSVAGISVSESSWEFGAGAGVGFRVSDFLGLELSYERIDEADVINGSLRFGF